MTTGFCVCLANSVVDLISVPFQNNFNFGAGTDRSMVWVMNVLGELDRDDRLIVRLRRLRSVPRQRPVEHGPDRGRAVHGGSLGAGSARESEVVDRRLESQSLQPVPPAAVHQLQSLGGLVSRAPIITGNFSAGDGDHWTLPIGAGIGKLWRLGKISLPLNTQIVPYYNAVTPELGPDWQLRFQLQFLFPR